MRKRILILILCLFFKQVDLSAEVIKVTLPGDVPMYFAKIDSGSFLMGSPDTLPNNWNGCPSGGGLHSCYEPAHIVKIGYQFYMGVYEVTQRQWVAIMDTNPSSYKCLDCPVEKVSWTDCKVFLEKLNALGIGKFRLPSEAEWEYSCRAGSTTKFYFGDLPDSVCKPEGGPCPELDKYAMWGGHADKKTIQPVGSFLPNAWGLYDMIGNVYEWCEDHFTTKGYVNTPNDGSAWVDTIPHERVSRGAWRGYTDPLKYVSYFRGAHAEDTRHGCCGVRIVREIGGDVIKTIGNSRRLNSDRIKITSTEFNDQINFSITGISKSFETVIINIAGHKIANLSWNDPYRTLSWNKITNKGDKAVKGTYLMIVNKKILHKFLISQ